MSILLIVTIFTIFIANCRQFRRHVIEPMILTLVGNKIDLEKTRAVSREEAFVYASSINGGYYETSAISDHRGIEAVFISTARGLLRLSQESECSSIKRYESSESIISCNDLTGKIPHHFPFRLSLSLYKLNWNTIHIHWIGHDLTVHTGLTVDSNVEANAIGRLETAPWSIEHIAHGDPQRSGWCCY